MTVRIGNGAMDQVQMDIYGEAMDGIFFAEQALDRRGLARAIGADDAEDLPGVYLQADTV